ncbi:hypothetical protein CDL12_18111 [Handroanthus impetiginosus]|uniref:Non-specific lipid-transfer protein n=1 Tax=Handroanthus impetiginosus TaxID=429701 RepID=A0A2G9GVJ9_9LAMI|nr:hypothetical protein CDL12_18111 [Handroanthus impetiginosus]
MAYSSRTCLAALAVLALICSPAPATSAVSCTQAVEYLMPCQSFLMGLAEISSSCCLGAQALAQATVSQTDRKSVCQCLKQIASSINVNQDKAKELPQLCKIDVPVPVRTDINCDL